MAVVVNATAERLRDGRVALGFGIQLLRSAAAPHIARAAGFHWLFIDMEHGAITLHDTTQLCIASLATGITPIVRIAKSAFDEGVRALDNGAQGIVVPHVDTAEEARAIVTAFRYPPTGRRSWGGNQAQFGYQPPPAAEGKRQVDEQLLVIVMLESEEAVSNADEIAATPGIDVLLIGASDLTGEMGIPGQWGHERLLRAYASVSDACVRHGKVLGSGGIYDSVWSKRYRDLGVRLLIGGNDTGFVLAAARERAQALSGDS
ncbi:MAG: HpcH/HpaI aldolase/citrate lyase family protein [Lautropia sp.]